MKLFFDIWTSAVSLAGFRNYSDKTTPFSSDNTHGTWIQFRLNFCLPAIRETSRSFGSGSEHFCVFYGSDSSATYFYNLNSG